ncbi:hypothetical protein TSUD_418820, partial [Trifolium subterraneum]
EIPYARRELQIPVKPVEPIVFCVPTPFPFESMKKVPWNYQPTAYVGGKPLTNDESNVTNIVGIGSMTRSGRIFSSEQPNKKSLVKGESVEDEVGDGPSRKTLPQEEAEEFLRIIRKSDYRIVDQLGQTPSKISMLSLLLSSEAHREALLKVLNEAHVTRDITVDQFDGVVGNITASRYLGFSEDELPAEGHNHNRALHISVKCLDNILSRVLVDTGFRRIKKNSCGRSRPTHPMDINPTYSCLLGRPWIHDAGAVTSTLHQKLKFITGDKMIVVSGQEDMMVSHLSSFRYIEADEEATEVPFQALEIASVMMLKSDHSHHKRKGSAMSSWKAMKEALEEGSLEGWGRLPDVLEKKDRFGLRYQPSTTLFSKDDREGIRTIQEMFCSAGFIHEGHVAMLEDTDEEVPNLVYRCAHDEVLTNWKAVEIPETFSISKSIIEPHENDIATIPYDFEFPINQAEEGDEDDGELPEGLAQILKPEEKVIQPYQESVEVINLGTEEDKKEIKVGALLKENVKGKLVELLREYVDVFAWSYQDMTRPDMALKIIEEVKKQFDAGFLAVAKYPQWVANIVPVPKKDGKVRMCVDYRDLNRASPKDDFPLPHIDVLVDNTAQFSVFSFMDGFSGYNQIKMSPEDMEKTTFITPWGTFCYKVMPFELKNAGATYQRAMVTLFHDMIHK